MKGLAAIVFLTLAAPVSAASYKVVLSPPEGTSVVRGYGGLHAVDARTDTTLVRLISPGSDVRERGTIRVWKNERRQAGGRIDLCGTPFSGTRIWSLRQRRVQPKRPLS